MATDTFSSAARIKEHPSFFQIPVGSAHSILQTPIPNLMLLWLLEQLGSLWPDAMADHLPALEKITFRASLAAMASFLLAVVLGPRMIAWLRERFREPIRSGSAEVERLHGCKESTPTMGGLFIVAGLTAGVLLFADLGNRYVLVGLLVVSGLAMIGAVDDLVKLRGTANGISARGKLAGQLVVALLAAVLIYQHHAGLPDGLTLHLPLAGSGLGLGIWFIPLAVIVIVGSSNAVNLTDGLDGLAGGCLIFAGGAMTLVAYASGHAELAQYLSIPRIPGSGEMTILAGAMIGGLLGFLWFNCHPAQVFMGDTGSLPLGGLLGLMAVVTRQEVLLLVVGGVFVVEAASVILQIGSNRLRGRRIFLCAPLHHHFQFKGWAENKIVVRFWIASALCALLGMATLKLHVQEDQRLDASGHTSTEITKQGAPAEMTKQGAPAPGTSAIHAKECSRSNCRIFVAPNPQPQSHDRYLSNRPKRAHIMIAERDESGTGILPLHWRDASAKGGMP